MPEKFDNTTLREEITDYLYENAIPTHDTIESMTDDIVDIFVSGEEVHGVQKFCHECGQALDWRV